MGFSGFGSETTLTTNASSHDLPACRSAYPSALRWSSSRKAQQAVMEPSTTEGIRDFHPLALKGRVFYRLNPALSLGERVDR